MFLLNMPCLIYKFYRVFQKSPCTITKRLYSLSWNMSMYHDGWWNGYYRCWIWWPSSCKHVHEDIVKGFLDNVLYFGGDCIFQLSGCPLIIFLNVPWGNSTNKSLMGWDQGIVQANCYRRWWHFQKHQWEMPWMHELCEVWRRPAETKHLKNSASVRWLMNGCSMLWQ